MSQIDFKIKDNLEGKWKTYLYILTISSIFFIYLMLEYSKFKFPLIIEYLNIIPFIFLIYSWIYWLLSYRMIDFLPRKFDYDEIAYYSRKTSLRTKLLDTLIATFYITTILILFIAMYTIRWY